MFTGLIEEVGTIEAIANGPAGRELRIRSEYTGLVDGESERHLEEPTTRLTGSSETYNKGERN